MSNEQNKAAAQRIYDECFNKGNLAAADEVFDANFVDHNMLPAQEAGVAGFKQIVTMFRTSFPDLRFEVEEMITVENKVVSRWTAHGTDTGGYMGMTATNRQAHIQGIDILRLDNGKVVERWGVEDLLGLMMQLGLIPAPGQ